MCNESFRPANSAAIVHYSTDENKTRSNSLNRLAVNLGWAFGGLFGGTSGAINYHLVVLGRWLHQYFSCIAFIKADPRIQSGKTIKNAINTVKVTSAYKDGIYLDVYRLCHYYLRPVFFSYLPCSRCFIKLNGISANCLSGLLMGVKWFAYRLFRNGDHPQLEGKRHPLQYICIGVLFVGLGICVTEFSAGRLFGCLLSWFYNHWRNTGDAVYEFVLDHATTPAIAGSMPHCIPLPGQPRRSWRLYWRASDILVGYDLLWWITGAICLWASVGFISLYRSNH